ncbi:1-acyl-sn-glycerol-3-phosphate acyltransferase epsilon-like [Tropilaelaps mercedesae]|uniref:1-acyl-sn-glycerol-3-phosphate acyltransferase epsilon-like n=1 Tax=Tropilaelaps mercedesae TaxID=418985 RepID=A0A1V9XHQ5_9ACAR|nr:1-acyl-sn-glycerol-3-phosphate acyltransferase epsilon-like [Tropilaelaps mercedesae]
MINNTVIKWGRVFLNLLALLGTVAPLFAFWFTWRVISLGLPAHIYHKVDDLVFEFYQRFALVLAETFARFQVFLYGDFERLIDKRERFLLMSNHQSATDWIVGDCISERLGRLGQLRYFMKDVLQAFPIYGFYFHHHGCIYVNREQCNFDKMRRHLVYLQDKRIPSVVAIFPEGTRYQGLDKLGASHAFAEKNGLRKLNHVRYPRTRGVKTTIAYMRQNIDAIYDATVIYEGTKRGNKRLPAPSLIDLFTGQCRSVHVYLERIPIEDVPEDEEKIKNFIFVQFNKKEDLMSRYYDNDDGERADGGPFPGPVFQRNLNWLRQSIALVLMILLTAFFACTPSGLTISAHVWIFGTLFGYAWLFISSVA